MSVETTIWWQGWASPFPGQLNPKGSHHGPAAWGNQFLLQGAGMGRFPERRAKKLALKDMSPESIMGILKSVGWGFLGKGGDPYPCKTSQVREKAR